MLMSSFGQKTHLVFMHLLREFLLMAQQLMTEKIISNLQVILMLE
jgi:hypothetical protein